MNFQEKLHSGYYDGNGFPYVSASEARKDPTKNYERERYLNDGKRRAAEFKAEAFEELGITNNPKRDVLYSKAYERGHSNGFREIFIVMDDLLDLIT